MLFSVGCITLRVVQEEQPFSSIGFPALLSSRLVIAVNGMQRDATTQTFKNCYFFKIVNLTLTSSTWFKIRETISEQVYMGTYFCFASGSSMDHHDTARKEK